MKKILTGALAALTIGGALAASTVPASAEPWRGHDHGWHGRGWGYGAAGLVGLATGVAIANSYDRPYYAPPPYYYGPPVPRCRVEMRWNPGWGGYDRVRVCY